MTEITYETRELLATAYRGKLADGPFLTHVVPIVDGLETRPLCGRIKAEHVADSGSLDDDELDGPASCPICAKRDPRNHQEV